MSKSSAQKMKHNHTAGEGQKPFPYKIASASLSACSSSFFPSKTENASRYTRFSSAPTVSVSPARPEKPQFVGSMAIA